MTILNIIGIIYLIIGVAYALYIAIKTPQSIIHFPINILFGPSILFYILVTSLKGKRLPVDTPNV